MSGLNKMEEFETEHLRTDQMSSPHLNDDCLEELEYEHLPTDQSSIFHLNDDCLFKIASMLSLRDLLSLSQVCQRFEYIANVQFSKCKNLDPKPFRSCTLMEIREIMSRVGPSLQKVKCIGVPTIEGQRFIRFLPKFCSNVRTFEFIDVKGMHSDIYTNLFQGFENLTKLTLQLCNLGDDLCEIISNYCKNLENLNLSLNLISGEHLQKLTKLKVLDLGFCINLQPLHFEELMANVKLESLNIEGCYKLKSSFMKSLLRHQTELMKLNFSYPDTSRDLSPLAQLKNLKHLRVSDIDNDMFFEDLAFYKMDLEKLEIPEAELNASRKRALLKLKNLKQLCISQCRDIDNDFICQMASRTPLIYLCFAGCDDICNIEILNIIKKSNTIEKICISSCYQFRNELIFDAIDILKEKQRVTRLTFAIGRTSISKFIQMHPKIRENSHLVHFEFGTTHFCENRLKHVYDYPLQCSR